ncbi:MAG: PD-(D/E)XK nuclease family protein, partial [Deltaproteobacteria bacterium]
SEYGRIVEDVFSRFHLPLYFRRGNPLISNPLIKTILTLIEIIRSQYARDQVLKFLSSNYVRFPRKSTPEGLSAGKLEATILESGMIDARSMSWDECLRRHGQRLERKLKGEGRTEKRGELESKLFTLRPISEAIGQFIDLLEDFRKPKSFGDFLGGLKKLLDLFGLRSRIQDASEPEILKRDLAALDIFEELLGNLSETLRTAGLERKQTEIDEFFTLLLESLTGASLPDSGINRSGIKVLHVRDTLGLSFDYLFLGGLTDGQFPEKKYESPIFTDDDKARFNEQAGRAVFRKLLIRHQEEPLLFYLVLTTARKHLYLTYSTLDSKGNLALPSTLLKGLLRLIDTPPLKEQKQPDSLFQEIDFFRVPKLLEAYERNELLESLIKGLYGSNPGPPGPELYLATYNSLIFADRHSDLKQALRMIFHSARIEREREKFYLAEEEERERQASPWTGRITNDLIIKQINEEFICGEGIRLSPTLLEDYAQCPFRFFMGRILGMAELPSPEVEPDRMTEGTVIHDILRVFYQERFDQGKLPLSGSEEEDRHLKEVGKRVFEKWELQEHLGDDRFWEIRKEEILKRLHRFIRFEASLKEKQFIPTRFELPFGAKASELSPLVIEDESGFRTEFRGKIDRLDLSPDGSSYRVVDYKNSRNDYGELNQKKLGEVSFQIPVYLLAGEMFVQKTGKAEQGSGRKATIYLLKNSEPKKSKDFTSDDLERFKIRIVSLIQRTSKGIFDISPFQDECSPFCEFRNICRYQPVEKKQEE